MAGFQSTKGDPAGRETAEKPYKKGVFTRWRCVAPPGKRGAYQVLPGPATPGRAPMCLLFSYACIYNLPISPIPRGNLLLRRGSHGWPTRGPGRESPPLPGGSRRPPRAPTMTICMPMLPCHCCPVRLCPGGYGEVKRLAARGSSGSLPG